MAKKPQKMFWPAPVDPLSNIPLPIYVTAEKYNQAYLDGVKFHKHHLYFNEKRQELQGIGGLALRLSIVEELPEDLHNSSHPGSVHDRLIQPNVLPTTQSEQFKTATLAVAKVVPREAVNLRANDPSQPKRLKDEEHKFISMDYVTHVDGGTDQRGINMRDQVGSFFIEYALQEEFMENIMNANRRSAFLRAKGDKIKYLGNEIVLRCLKEALSPVKEVYDMAVDQGMVQPRYKGLEASVRKIIPWRESKYYFPLIYDFLESNAVVQSAPLQTEVDRLELAA